jgi:hypothetical protein
MSKKFDAGPSFFSYVNNITLTAGLIRDLMDSNCDWHNKTKHTIDYQNCHFREGGNPETQVTLDTRLAGV